MPQYTLTKKLPNHIVGQVIVNDVTDFSVGATLTGGTSNATAKIRKIDTENNILIVDNINGIFEPAEVVTDGTETATVAANGFDISITESGIVRTIRRSGRVLTEVLTSIRSLATKVTDIITLPTFSAAVTYSATSAMETGDIMTITVTASEPVKVSAAAFVEVTIGAATVSALLNPATSTSTSLKFEYEITEDNSAEATEVSVGTTIVGKVYDIVDQSNTESLVTVTFVAPNTTAATVNAA